MVKTRQSKKEAHDDNRPQRDKRKVKTSSMKRNSGRCNHSRKNRAKGMKVATSQSHTGCGSGILPSQIQKLIKERKAEFQRQLREKIKNNVERLKAVASDSVSRPSHQVHAWGNLLDPPPSEDDDSNVLFINPAYDGDVEKNRVRDILLPLMLHYKAPIVQNLSECPIWDPKFLNLRQVSRSMQQAMDRCFDNELDAAMWNNNKVSWEWWINRKPIELYMPYDPNAFNKILEIKPPLKLIRKEMEVTIKSPSKIRSYKNPSLKYLDHFNKFKENVTKVLNQVGNQILSFEFTFGKMAELEQHGISITQIYLILIEWLELLPNLKWLKIIAGIGCTSKEVKAPATLKRVDETVLCNQPPPTLDFLVRFDFSVTTDYDYDYFSIGDIIAAANPHVKMLYFYGNDFHRRVPQSCIEWLELESLIIESHHYSEPIALMRNLHSPNSRWNLKVLTLYVKMKGAPINAVFTSINKFPNLEHLTLAIGSITIGGEIDFLWLRKLKEVSFEFDPIIFEQNFNENVYFFFSLQFLLYSSKLESIIWKNLGGASGQLQREIEVHRNGKIMVVGFKNRGFNDIYDANLRDIFPYLIEVCVECSEVSDKWNLYDDDDSESDNE